MVGGTIGEGAFGKVLYGKHKATQREVAIKVVPKYSVVKYPHLLQSLMKERKILTRANNSNSNNNSSYIVSLWASFHDEQCLYLVMDCATRGNLTELIQHSRFVFIGIEQQTQQQQLWREVVVPYYGLQLLQALEYLHFELQVIHADIKPDNILIRDDGRLQLADFGSAIIVMEDEESNNHTNDDDDYFIMTRGTVDYAAPELIKGLCSSFITYAVDLWAFGCVLYAMLLMTGESPFHAASDALAVQKIMNHAVQLTTNDNCSTIITNNDDAVPTEWMDLLLQLLHPDPLKRIIQTGNDHYASIRSHKVFRNVDSNHPPPYLPPRPSWWTDSQTTTTTNPMRDGCQGWTVFLVD